MGSRFFRWFFKKSTRLFIRLPFFLLSNHTNKQTCYTTTVRVGLRNDSNRSLAMEFILYMNVITSKNRKVIHSNLKFVQIIIRLHVRHWIVRTFFVRSVNDVVVYLPLVFEPNLQLLSCAVNIYCEAQVLLSHRPFQSHKLFIPTSFIYVESAKNSINDISICSDSLTYTPALFRTACRGGCETYAIYLFRC